MVTLVPLLALGGCKKVEEVPADLDGVMHFLWQGVATGDDAALAEGVLNLDAALGGATLEDTTDGSISRLSATDVAPLGITDRNPADAAGIFMGGRILCALSMVAEIVTFPDQAVIYTGVYDFYDRAYDGEIDPFLAGDPDELGWSIDYGASVIGSSYTGHNEAFLRRVDIGPDGPFDTAYLARYYAPEPAVFEEGSSKTFDQDYQFEVYWSRIPGETLHAYAMWRQADWGSGFTSEGEDVQRLLLNAMADWDRDTEKICEDGGP
jgi:hypothetical protein